MESWRERGFVPDSDEEEGFESQNSVAVVVPLPIESTVRSSGKDVNETLDHANKFLPDEYSHGHHIDDDDNDSDDDLNADTPTRRIDDRRTSHEDQGEEITPRASETKDQGNRHETPSLRKDTSPQERTDALFSQTLSDAPEPSPPSTPNRKPQKHIWDLSDSSPDELQLDFVPSRGRPALSSRLQKVNRRAQEVLTEENQGGDKTAEEKSAEERPTEEKPAQEAPAQNTPTKEGEKNYGLDEISPLSSPLSSIHSLSLSEDNDAEQTGEGPLAEDTLGTLEDLIRDAPEDVIRELTHPGQRSLRQRNPIQLHPYLLEDAKYRRLMKQGGMQPVRIAQALQAAANASQNQDLAGGAASPSSSPMADSNFAPSSPVDDGHTADKRPRNSPIRRDPALFVYSPGGTRPRAQKRRKVSKPADPAEVDRLRRLLFPQVVIDSSPSSSHLDSDSIFDVPPSPPRSASASSSQTINAKEFRFPRGLSPRRRNPPSPEPTAARREADGEEEDADAMDWDGPLMDNGFDDVEPMATQDEADSDVDHGEQEAEEDEHEANKDEGAVRDLRRRIKGVLPASWLRLDQQKQQDDRLGLTQRHRDSRQENAKGVARKVTKSNTSMRQPTPGRHLNSLRDLADPDSSDDAEGGDNPVLDSRQELARLVGFDDPFQDQDMGGDIMEDNRIDYMFPSIPRGPSAPRSKKPATAKLQKDNGAGIRFTDLNKRPRLKRQARLTDPVYGSRKERKSPRAPRIGILDAPDVATRSRSEQPQFLRVAARNARARRDQGRTSPSRKVFQLSSKTDTHDANHSLRQWRKGKLRQTRLSGPQTKPQAPHQQPLIDLSSNRKQKRTGNASGDTDKSHRGETRPAPKESRGGTDPVPRPEALTSGPAPEERPTADKPVQSYRQGRNWIVRRNVALTSLSKPVPRPATIGSSDFSSAAFQQSLAALNRGYRSKNLPKSREVNPILDRFLAGNLNPPESKRTPRVETAQTPIDSDDALPKERHQIHRPQIRKRPPRRIDINAPERQETLPSFFEPEVSGVQNEAFQPTGYRPGALVGYCSSYTIDFSITPLHPGTFFHESTFVGSGEFSRSLVIGKRDLDRSVGGACNLHIGNSSFRWGPWNDTVFSELGIAFNTMLEELERRNAASVGGHAESMPYQCCTMYRSLVRYLTDNLTFTDPIDRAGFIQRSHELVTRLNEGLETLSSMRTADTGWLTTMAMYNLVFANQTYQIACHDIVTGKLRDDALNMVTTASRQVSSLMSSAAGQRDIKGFLEDNNVREKRECGIRDDRSAAQAYVVAQHVLLSTDSYRGLFEGLWNSICSQSVSDQTTPKQISQLEDEWSRVFSMLPLTEIDSAGIARIGSRFKEARDNWRTIELLLRPVLDSYDPKSATPISYNNYCRALFHRCFHLINAWGWRDCKRILDTLYDFFAKNTLYNLEHEESFGSPSFLDELDQSPFLDIKFGEPCFHILLKIIASGFRFMSKTYEKKKIRNFAWRLLPNHGRVYPKEKPLQQTDLAALRNHHDLLCTLYSSVPDGCRPRLEAIKNLVDPAGSHQETCNISLLSWNRLVRFKLSTGEDASGLEQFADWHAYFVGELLKQHGLARKEVEAQNTGENKFSRRLVESTISQNQRQIESLLKTALNGLQSAIASAPTVEHAEKLAEKTPINAVLGLFNPRVSRVNATVSEGLQVIQAYLRKCHPAPAEAANGPPTADEDSQDYGDWTAIQALYEDDVSPAKPQGVELVEKVFHPIVSRLVSNCFGEDNCPDDAVLRNVVDCWTSIAQTLVKHGSRHWTGYLSPYNSHSWESLRSTIQTRKYTPKFLASCIEKDIGFVFECRVQVYTMWMSCLVERSSMLKFQHSLTEALLNGDSDNPILQNLPFSRGPRTKRYSMTLEDLRQRRLSLISSILSNIRAHVLELEDTDSRDLQSSKQEYRELIQRMMSSMKANYKELGNGGTAAHGDYVDFVHRVVGFLQQYTRDICPIDSFFTDPSSFPLPSADPTYIVARLKSYEPRLSSGKFAKTLIIFIQAVSERAAVDGQQSYLVEQLHSSMAEAYESGDPGKPTLRALLLQTIFPAYIETALSTPAGWVIGRPIIQTISLTFKEILFNIDTTDPRCVSSLISIFNSVFRSSYQSLLSVVDNADLLKQPPVVLTIATIVEMITSSLRVIDYIDRVTDLAANLISQMRIFRRIILFAASYIHGRLLPDTLDDFADSADFFTRDIPPTNTISTPVFFQEISASATRELQAYINESWSCHQGKYYFTRRGCHQAQEIQIEPSVAVQLESCTEAVFDDAVEGFLDTLDRLELVDDYD